ncbi:hypothetical protein AB0F91_25185 [Amycolatopsis sp. NPDC023774]|uniref:hypothetical protein n=1 Tax=Amycolatopsis sp. NPDC023774 TaxID=3155015 RepID=UPI003410799A
MEADFTKVPKLAEKINCEVVEGAGADLVFADWTCGFSESTGFTPDTFTQLGIQSDQLTEACRDGVGKQCGIMPPLAALYSNLAQPRPALRRLRPRGETGEAIPRPGRGGQEGRRHSGATAHGVPLRRRPRPAVHGRPQGWPPRGHHQSGDTNIFSDVDDSWTTVSREAVVQRSPDIILTNDYGGEVGTVADKDNVLRSQPACVTSR